MELETFISQTLESIIKGTQQAIDYANENDTIINPKDVKNSEGNHSLISTKDHLLTVTKVSFDVAVTVSYEEGAKAGAGIKVIEIFKLDSGINVKEINHAMSRIKFDISMVLPNNHK